MLNMDTIYFRDKLDNEEGVWADYILVQCLAGLLYSMEDNYKARDPQKIIDAFLDKFRKLEDVENTGTIWVYISTLKDLMKKIREILLSIPEFVELNSNNESAHFIDLDAFFQNVWYALNSKLLVDTFYSCKKFDIILS